MPLKEKFRPLLKVIKNQEISNFSLVETYFTFSQNSLKIMELEKGEKISSLSQISNSHYHFSNLRKKIKPNEESIKQKKKSRIRFFCTFFKCY